VLRADTHLTSPVQIYDLNNVPLVSGTSMVKWHLPHSIHGEHRGRTARCPITNHRVEYNYTKMVAVRIAIDRNSNLSECAVEFEVTQEFDQGGVGREEKVVLGKVSLNLAEYVEASESILRDTGRPGTADSRSTPRKRVSVGPSASPTSIVKVEEETEEVEEGVVRRYLMQESKVNSTLKIGILMVQVDGDRNFVAPPLKTASMFGGIAGIMAEQVDAAAPQEDGAQSAQPLSTKSRDANDMHDMYRRALAASWACQPGELKADECIEDIFGGGTGFGQATEHHQSPSKTPHHHQQHQHHRSRSHSRVTHFVGVGGGDDNSTSDDDVFEMGSTLRPQDIRQFQRLHHNRHQSGASDRSVGTVTRGDDRRGSLRGQNPLKGGDPAGAARAGDSDGVRSRSESLTSLAPTLGSDRGKEGFRRAREVDEFEVRDDLVAWALRETVT